MLFTFNIWIYSHHWLVCGIKNASGDALSFSTDVADLILRNL